MKIFEKQGPLRFTPGKSGMIFFKMGLFFDEKNVTFEFRRRKECRSGKKI